MTTRAHRRGVGVGIHRIAATILLVLYRRRTPWAASVLLSFPRYPWLPVMAAAVLALPRLSTPALADDPAARLADHRRWVISSDQSRDGQTIVTTGGDSLLYRPGDVIAWRADGTRIGEFVGHPTIVWCGRISADGRWLATAGYDGLVKLWDVASRQPKHDLKKHKGWVRSVAFSPDGSRLASAGEDGTVVIWDTASGAEVKTVAAHAAAATCVAFAADGQTLASGGSDKVVKLWDPASGTEKGKLEGHGDAIWALAWSPDGSRLATASADRTIRLWAMPEARELAAFAGHKDWVTSVAFSPDGSRLVSGSLDGSVKLWSVAELGEQAGPEPMGSSVWSVGFSPNASTILVGTHAGARLVPTPEAKLLPRPVPPPQPVVRPLVPQSFTSMAGASGAIAADGVVTVTGPLAKDTYTVKATLPQEGGRVSALRLEVLTDSVLPQQGPGRAGNGNFVLTTFAALAGPPGGTDTPTAITFAEARADFEQDKYGVAGAIDTNPETGWAVSGGIGKPHEATFRLAPDVALPPGSPVTITLDQQYPDGQHAIGRFRLSVVQEPPPPAAP